MRREVWKDIPGWEGCYQVSDKGRVRSIDRHVRGSHSSTRLVRGRLLTAFKDSKSRYYMVALWRGNKKHSELVHRLVALTFLGPCPPGQRVLHGRAGINVNRVSNLRYGTQSENMMDRYRDGTVWDAIPVRRSDGVEFPSLREAARQSKTRQPHITSVCRGQRKTAGGFSWRYV